MAVFPGEGVSGKYRPLAIALIISLNVLVYVYTSLSSSAPLLASSNESILRLGFEPVYMYVSPSEALLRIFTSMFVHADLFHIFFNMYFLWLFGSRIEKIIGHGRTLLLYFLSGISAVLFHVAFIPVGGYESMSIPAVGASGAISGVLGAYLLMLPHTRLVMCTFFFLIPFCFKLPASVFLVLWFVEQIVYGYMKLGGVAYFAHIGGFVMGLALAPLLVRGVTRRPSYLDYIYRYFSELYGIQLTKPRGIGTGTKVLLTVLLVGVIVGFAYGAYTSVQTPVYALDVTSKYGESAQREPVVVAILDGQAVISPSQYDYVRIVLNRLTPLVYSNEYLGTTVVDKTLNYVVRVSGITVPVKLSIERAKYDEKGVMVYMKGTMETTSVLVDIYGQVKRGENLVLDFAISASPVDEYSFMAFSLLAIAICVFGISAILRGEETAIFTQPSLPDIFPYV